MSERDGAAYIVQQGDHVRKLAHRFGLSAEDLWNHPKNADLAARRASMDALCPEDILFIPTSAREALPLTRGTENRFIAKVPTVHLTLRLRDGDTPMANEPFLVHGVRSPIGSPSDRTTDDTGIIELDLPIWTRELTVELPKKQLKYFLRVGDMHCLNTGSGVVMRLGNLGCYTLPSVPGPEAEAEALSTAIRRFQRSQGLEPSGVLDDATRGALLREYGS